jgi:hypothetical protein
LSSHEWRLSAAAFAVAVFVFAAIRVLLMPAACGLTTFPFANADTTRAQAEKIAQPTAESRFLTLEASFSA